MLNCPSQAQEGNSAAITASTKNVQRYTGAGEQADDGSPLVGGCPALQETMSRPPSETGCSIRIDDVPRKRSGRNRGAWRRRKRIRRSGRTERARFVFFPWRGCGALLCLGFFQLHPKLLNLLSGQVEVFRARIAT